MPKILDTGAAKSVAEDIISELEYNGVEMEEAIPALVQAIVNLADGNDQILDEAANLLADGGVFDE